MIIGSGSGETGSLVTMAQKAKKQEAGIITITLQPDATIGKLADAKIVLVGKSQKAKMTGNSIQPMGNAFEQMSWLVYDNIIMVLMERLNISEDEMFARHANLE